MAACFLVRELDANQSVVMATPPSHSYQYREKDGRDYEGSNCHSLWEGVPGDLAKQQPMKSRTKKEQEPPRVKSHPVLLVVQGRHCLTKRLAVGGWFWGHFTLLGYQLSLKKGKNKYSDEEEGPAVIQSASTCLWSTQHIKGPSCSKYLPSGLDHPTYRQEKPTRIHRGS